MTPHKAKRPTDQSPWSVKSQAPVNNSARQSSPRPPLLGSATTFDRRGARAMGTKPAPLLVLARCRTHNHITKNQKQPPCASRTATQKYQIYFRT